MNIIIDSHRVTKRWGYQSSVDLGTGDNVQKIISYKSEDAVQEVLFLTDKDLCKRESASGKTYTFRTEAYTTGTITDITTVTVTGSGTSWNTEVAAGDYFIMDDDHVTDEELDASWIEIDSVTDDTHIVLKSAYTKNGTTYKIRKVYSVPSNERWSTCIARDKLILTSGNVNVQYYDGTGAAADLDSTEAVKARYCLPYAQRLLIADLYVSATREPWSLRYSALTDPTDWTDPSAGQVDFLSTDKYITGMGQVGNNVLVYKEDSIIFGYRTGQSTSPLAFPTEKYGVGNYAPHSLVHFLGANAFIGRNNIYIINGDHPQAIGDPIKETFFSIVSDADLKKVWGVALSATNELVWKAVTNEGAYFFSFNWAEKSWTTYEFYHDINGIGEI